MWAVTINVPYQWTLPAASPVVRFSIAVTPTLAYPASNSASWNPILAVSGAFASGAPAARRAARQPSDPSLTCQSIVSRVSAILEGAS